MGGVASDPAWYSVQFIGQLPKKCDLTRQRR